jgi:hypothetical protein
MTEVRRCPPRHSRADGNPVGWLEATYHLEIKLHWIPASAGMTATGETCYMEGIWVAKTLGIA